MMLLTSIHIFERYSSGFGVRRLLYSYSEFCKNGNKKNPLELNQKITSVPELLIHLSLKTAFNLRAGAPAAFTPPSHKKLEFSRFLLAKHVHTHRYFLITIG